MRRLGLGPDHHSRTRRKPVESIAEKVSQPSANGVAHDGTTDGTTDDEPGTNGGAVAAGSGNHVNDHQWASGPDPVADRAAKLLRPAQAVLGRQHANSSHRMRHGRPVIRRTDAHGPCDDARR